MMDEDSGLDLRNVGSGGSGTVERRGGRQIQGSFLVAP